MVVYNLDDLGDVVITSPATGNVLSYNGTNWVNDSVAGGGATDLDDLSDVVISSPSNNQFLRYNGTNWVNATVGIVGALDDLSDVVISSPSNGQVLAYNGTSWVNTTAGSASALNDLTDVVISGQAAGDSLWYDNSNWRVYPKKCIDPTNSAYGLSTAGSAADNATAMNAAIAAAISANLPLIIPAGRYKMANLDVIDHTVLTEGSSLIVDSTGPVYLLFQYGSLTVPFDIDITGGVVEFDVSSVSTVTSGGSMSSESEVTQVTLTGAPSDLLQTDQVSLVCNKFLPYYVNPYERNFQHEISEVWHISGSNVFLTEKLLRDYTSGYSYIKFYRWANRDTKVYFGEHIIFSSDQDQDGNADEDWNSSSITAAQRPAMCLRIAGVRNPIVKSSFEKPWAGGVRIVGSMGARIEVPSFMQVNNLLSGQTVYGYAIAFDGANRFPRVTGVDGYHARHVTTTWIEEQQLLITGISKAAQAVVTYTRPSGNSTHPAAGDLVYISSVVGMTELNGNWYTVSSVNTGAGTMVLNVDSTGFTTYVSGGTANMFQPDQWYRYGECTHRRVDNIDGRFNYGPIGDSHENEYGVYYTNIRVVAPVEFTWSAVNPKAMSLRGAGCTVDGFYLERGQQGIAVQSFELDHGIPDIKTLRNLRFKSQQDKAAGGALIDISGNASVTSKRKLLIDGIDFEDCYRLISKEANSGDIEIRNITYSGDWGVSSPSQYAFGFAGGNNLIENGLLDFSAMTNVDLRILQVTGGVTIVRNVHFKGIKSTGQYPFVIQGTGSQIIFDRCTFEFDSSATDGTVRFFQNNNVYGLVNFYGCRFINPEKVSSTLGLINISGTSSNAVVKISGDQRFEGTLSKLIGLSSSATTSNYTYTQAFLRTGTGAPSANANFLGEQFFNTASNQLYIAKAVGTGASDWYALN